MAVSNKKLGSTSRQQICNSVMAATDFEEKIDSLHAEMGRLAGEHLKVRRPVHFSDSIKHLPKEWFQHIASSYHSDSGRTLSFEAFPYPSDMRVGIRDTDEGRTFYLDVLEPIHTQIKSLVDQRAEVRAGVNSFLYSCATFRQVAERMPSFEAHLPSGSVSYPITADIQSMSQALLKSGFDKNVQL